MALNKEDKADIRGVMGKALANKVARVTRDKPRASDEQYAAHKRVIEKRKSRGANTIPYQRAYENRWDVSAAKNRAKSKVLKERGSGKKSILGNYSELQYGKTYSPER